MGKLLDALHLVSLIGLRTIIICLRQGFGIIILDLYTGCHLHLGNSCPNDKYHKHTTFLQAPNKVQKYTIWYVV